MTIRLRRSLSSLFALCMMLTVTVAGAASIPYEMVDISTPSEVKGAPPSESRAATDGTAPKWLPRIAASQLLVNEVEPNGTFGTASPIVGTNVVMRGSIFPNADVDWYSFTAAAGDRVYAALMTSFSANASSDSQLRLFQSDGTTLIEFDDDDGTLGSLSSTIAGATLAAGGTYYLEVRHFSATGQLRPYHFHFRLQSGAPTAEVEANDTPATANPLPANGWVSGARNPAAASEQDWYSLTLNAGDSVYLSLDLDPERDNVQWNGRLGFALFGDASNQILVVDDATAGSVANPLSEAMYFTVKAAGTYFAFVDSSSAATGGPTATYTLSVSVHPATPEGVNCTTYTSTDVPQVIGPGAGLVSSTITVPGNPRIADIDVDIVLNHTVMADIDAHLRSPAGNDNGLFTDIGASAVGGQTQMDIVFDDEAGIPPLFTVLRGVQFTPELAYRLNWFDGENAGGVWTLDLRDDVADANGGTLTSWSIRVCEVPTVPVVPACAVGFTPTTVFSTDFESGAAGFTHSGTADEWELGLPTLAPLTTCNSGANCWKTDLDNTYDPSSTQDLLSPNINLAGLSGPVIVTWAQRYQIENATFDHLSVDFQQVGGATPVRLFEWQDATMTNTVGNPAVTISESSGWSLFSRQVDSLAGLNTELRFHLDGDTTVQLAGLAIDDVSVAACRAISADLSITKTDGVATAVPGGSVVYTITASNAGPDGVTGATVADTFPAILTASWTCVGAGGGTCTAAGAGNINDTVNLPAGGSVTYTVSATISAAATGSLSNTATVSAAVTDPDPANNSATDTDTLSPQADLAITKTDGVTTATPGGSVTYTIVASNAGPSDAPGSTVADTFPATLTATWTCLGAGGGTCTAAGAGNINDTVNLPAGGSVTYTVSATISGAAVGTLVNTATVTAPAGVTDPNPANNSATDTDTLAASADVSITKTLDTVGPYSAGQSITYSLVVSNAGPSAATSVQVTDTPTNLTITAATSVNCAALPCTIPTMASGGSETITVTATIAAAGAFDNSATVSATETDPVPGNNTDNTGNGGTAGALGGAPFPANAALGPATLDDYESCDVTVQPAATLLLPYFEVDPSGLGENTLVTVTNVSDTSIVAHVTVWTNWSFPVLDFNLFLTGYDVVSLSLRDLLVSGNIPNTQRGTASPLGVRSRVGASTRIEAPYTTALLAATCANPQGGNGAVPGFLLSQIQSGLTGGPYSAGGVACGQVGDVSDNMIGYITFDTSAVCSQSLPTDAPYFATEIRWENQLIGDYIRLNDAAGVAGGNPLVHIKALPGGDSTPVTTLEWTFYNRYQGGVGVADRRQPLPALFAGRYIEAGTAFDTDFVVWREGVTDEVDTVDCNGALALNASFPYVEVVRFDERENPTTRIGGCQVSPCPPNIGLSETQLINVNNTSFIPSDPSADTGGWVYFNLTIPELDPLGWGRPSQNWVQVRMTGASLYGVDFDASYLGNGCQYHVGLTLPDGGTGSSSSGEKIGPKYERGTLTGWIGN